MDKETLKIICIILFITNIATIGFFGFTKYHYTPFQLTDSRSSVLKVNRFDNNDAYILSGRNWIPVK
jgi:hypothetical protein